MRPFVHLPSTPILVFLRLLVVELEASYRTDRQADEEMDGQDTQCGLWQECLAADLTDLIVS